jgi:hypothetical protein
VETDEPRLAVAHLGVRLLERRLPAAERLHLRAAEDQTGFDAVGGATLAVLPQLTGARGRGKKHWVPHLAIGVLEVGMAALTKTKAPKSGRRAQMAKLIATAKRARNAASDAVKAVA